MAAINKIYKKCNVSNSGIALFIVLWVLTIIMAIVFSFSFATRTETYSLISFKEGIERKFIAEAGIERAKIEILYRRQNPASEDIWRIDGTAYEDAFGEGYYKVKITDETGKVNINTASDIILRNLFSNMGIPSKEVDAIVDSIMDWKDKDDFHRLSGAESDYYMSLQNPYKAKNADFDTLEELIMVKGISSEMLYGKEDKRGIIDFLTLYSNANAINVNAAPKEVLSAIPGMTPEIADSIIKYRKDKEIKSLEEIRAILGGNYQQVAPYMSAVEGSVFSVDAAGYKKTLKGGYGIRSVIMFDNDKFRVLYYKMPVRAIDDRNITN